MRIYSDEELIDLYYQATPKQRAVYDRRLTIFLTMKVLVLAFVVVLILFFHWT